MLLPRPDTLQRVVFGGSPGEMEVVASYRDTIRKLERSHADAGKAKGAGKGKGKDQEKDDKDGQ